MTIIAIGFWFALGLLRRRRKCSRSITVRINWSKPNAISDSFRSFLLLTLTDAACFYCSRNSCHSENTRHASFERACAKIWNLDKSRASTHTQKTLRVLIFLWVSKTQNQGTPSDQSEQSFTFSLASENSKWKQENYLKRGKTRKTKLLSFLAFHLIDQEDGTSFRDQSQSKIKSKPKQFRITFDTRFKIAPFLGDEKKK